MSTNLKVKMAYADASTRNYSIDLSHIPQNKFAAFETHAKARANAINTAANDSSSSVAQTFVSNDGARMTSISELSIVYTEEEVIYNGGGE